MHSMFELIEHLRRRNVLKSPNIIKAFKVVDRQDFVSKDYVARCYEDIALPIGYGQTISQPTTVAIMLEALKPDAGQKILDIGSGSGWTTALLSCIVGNTGYVFGVERIAKLADFGKSNIKKYVDLKNTIIICFYTGNPA